MDYLYKGFSVVLLLSAGLFIGCDKDDPANVIQNLGEQPGLNGGFMSQCAKSDLANLSYRERLIFEGNSFTREQRYYQSDDCSEAETGGTTKVQGEFVVDADGLPESEAGSLQLNLQKAFIAPAAEYFVTALNTFNICGHNDYALNVEKEVTGGSDGIACPVQKVPQTLYGAYKLEGDQLYLNEGGVGQMSDNQQDQPTNLDTSAVYTRE